MEGSRVLWEVFAPFVSSFPMLKSPQKSSTVDRLSPIYVLVIVFNKLAKADLLPLTLQIAFLPCSSPLMSFSLVNALTMDLVVEKFSLVSTAIDILHDSFSWLLAINELAFVFHAFIDFFFSVTVRLWVFPLPRIWKYFAFEVRAEFDELPLLLKFTSPTNPTVKRPISKYKDSLLILCSMINDFPIVNVAIAKNDKYRLVVSTRNFAVFGKI